MLPKQYRLFRKQFNLVRKSGQKLFIHNFLIYYLPSDTLSVSVVISKKLAKKAVARNKLRRLIYNHLHQNYLDFPHSLIVYPQTHEINLSLLDQALSKLPKF